MQAFGQNSRGNFQTRGRGRNGFYRGCGRGRNFAGGRNYVVCQVCFKPGHATSHCFDHFDQTFQPSYPSHQHNQYNQYHSSGNSSSSNRSALLSTPEYTYDSCWFLILEPQNTSHLILIISCMEPSTVGLSSYTWRMVKD